MLQEILAGPILRRSEPHQVSVWLCTSAPRVVGLVVRRAEAPEAEPLATVTARSIRLGPGLFVHLATARPDVGCFPSDVLLAYDVEVQPERGGPARRLAELGMIGGSQSLAYEGYELPTFFLRGPGTEQLNVLHGSCRLLHGKREDAFLAADEQLARTCGDLRRRPSALLLTGDQIYADEVAGPLIGHLTRLGAALLGPGDDTSVPGLPPLSGIPVYGRQQLAEERAAFTSGKVANHLFSLGELAAAYLVAWRETNWPSRWPAFDDVVPDTGSDARQRARLRKQYRDEMTNLEAARRTVPAAARVLANVPTYTCFDDHDVTDDWNLTREWRQRVRDSPTGRRVVANALACFWAFQGWGNQPDSFDDAFIDTVTAGAEADAHRAEVFDRTLWDFDRWSYTVASDPPMFVLDTRTQRNFDSDQGAARLINDHEARRLVDLVTSAGVQAPGPVVLVSPVPVFGLELHSRLRRLHAPADRRIGPPPPGHHLGRCPLRSQRRRHVHHRRCPAASVSGREQLLQAQRRPGEVGPAPARAPRGGRARTGGLGPADRGGRRLRIRPAPHGPAGQHRRMVRWRPGLPSQSPRRPDERRDRPSLPGGPHLPRPRGAPGVGGRGREQRGLPHHRRRRGRAPPPHPPRPARHHHLHRQVPVERLTGECALQLLTLPGDGEHHGRISTETHSCPPASVAAALEATIAALHRDAASARHRLRRPRPRPRPRGTPALWDAGPIDSRPDDCWRCDALEAADALGLCPACRTDLCA